jgi:ABC transporter substrate binding protein (PQQ-dependent alcohol dehydrogenase system)
MSTLHRFNACLRLLLVLCAGQVPTAALAANWQVILIEQAANPELDRTRLERAYLGHPGGSAGDGLALAIEEAQFELQSEKSTVKLKVEAVGSLDAARAAAQNAEKTGATLLVVNLPPAWVGAVSAAVKFPVLNVAAGTDALREKDCAANLFHLAPSDRMRADALAQALVSRKWSSVLLLNGSSPQDAVRSAVAQAALKRYGLKTVAVKPFKLSTDPRERALGNLTLLTIGLLYDVVWVVDSDGEFARSLPYNTALARPVVGDGGLVAVGWQAQFERFGAPQVSRRFAKTAKRPMTSHDWSAWMAGKSIVAAAAATQKLDAASVHKALRGVNLDGSKGVAMQFRLWDRQLRQPIMLTDGQGVVGMMPLEGVMHPRNVLDTLGADEPEKLCKANS